MAIGDTIWIKGDECKIVSEPYELYGATWIDAVNENGKKLTTRTPDAVNAHVERQKREWHEQQAGFRRLHESQQGR